MKTRTAFFDAETVAAIGRGVDQVVIVGAGYDGRPLRFGGSGVRWIEVDHPSTQADKRQRLAAVDASLDHITFVGVDLTIDDVGAALSCAGHVVDKPTLFMCEGLFAYLPEEVSRSLCRALRRRACTGSVLAANFRVAPSPNIAAGSLRAAVDLLLSVIGERRQNEFRPGDAERLFNQSGWVVARRTTSHPNRLDGGTHLLLLSAEPAADLSAASSPPTT